MEIGGRQQKLRLPWMLQEKPSNEVENQGEARQGHVLNEVEMQVILRVTPAANAAVVDQWFGLLVLFRPFFSPLLAVMEGLMILELRFARVVCEIDQKSVVELEIVTD